MRFRSSLLSSAAVLLLLSAPAFAQQPAGAPRPAGPPRELSAQDMDFLKNAAIGGKAEVALGQLAQQNAQSQAVKQFGARMVRDHSTADAQLTAIASGKGVQLPQQLDAEHRQMSDRLAQLRGDAFDREYMRMMTEDHDKDVRAFRQESQAGTDPDIRRFAQQTLTVIEEHDRLAHDLVRSMTGVGTSRPPTGR